LAMTYVASGRMMLYRSRHSDCGTSLRAGDPGVFRRRLLAEPLSGRYRYRVMANNGLLRRKLRTLV